MKSEKKKLKVLSYNLHKGRNIWGGKFQFSYLKSLIGKLDADILCLQEVLGESRLNSKIKHQIEEMADEKWVDFSFAQNSVISGRDHGNAILSRFPIIKFQKIDLTVNRLEKRSLLYSLVKISNEKLLHCFCCHLNLMEKDRVKQIEFIIKAINSITNENDSVILCGDFNDWRGQANHPLEKSLGLTEVFLESQGKNQKTFPSFFPMLALDRIYTKNLEIINVHSKLDSGLVSYSDHLPLFCEVAI